MKIQFNMTDKKNIVATTPASLIQVYAVPKDWDVREVVVRWSSVFYKGEDRTNECKLVEEDYNKDSASASVEDES